MEATHEAMKQIDLNNEIVIYQSEDGEQHAEPLIGLTMARKSSAALPMI
ncbi:MAG: hypothetical protein PUD58_07120 [Prevotella sp.]|jgi:hypothetical protein|nr:hypothetical protein [Prevotella sp.]MDD6854057.1 hypothetical protein [Prevotella sp.]